MGQESSKSLILQCSTTTCTTFQLYVTAWKIIFYDECFVISWTIKLTRKVAKKEKGDNFLWVDGIYVDTIQNSLCLTKCVCNVLTGAGYERKKCEHRGKEGNKDQQTGNTTLCLPHCPLHCTFPTCILAAACNSFILKGTLEAEPARSMSWRRDLTSSHVVATWNMPLGLSKQYILSGPRNYHHFLSSLNRYLYDLYLLYKLFNSFLFSFFTCFYLFSTFFFLTNSHFFV